MKIIICGAGQVGYNIAAYLASEENDVTVIDRDQQRIDVVNEEIDVNGIVGHASNPDILNAANAKDADLILALTRSDEVNMVACQMGHSLFGVPKKIARIRNQTYLQPAWSNLFSRAHMPIDVIISPEVIIANEVFKRLSVPGTTYVSELAEGQMYLIGVICDHSCPLLHTSLDQLSNLFPDLAFKIVSILRKNKPLMPDAKEQLYEGDEVYFVVDTKHLKRTMSAFGHEEKEAHKVIIAGGGNIGLGLARLLKEKGRGIHLKVIEQDEGRAQYLSETLEDTIILHGSSLDRQILDEASISSTQTIVAVTNDDESNILGSLLAKQYGCNRTITLVNNNAYSPLVGPLGIDSMVSPRTTITAHIMQHVRRGRIKGVHNLRDNFAEIIEAEVSPTSKIVNTAISELDLPDHVQVVAVISEDAVIMPDSNYVIRAEDHVVVLVPHKHGRAIEKLLSVQVDIF